MSEKIYWPGLNGRQITMNLHPLNGTTFNPVSGVYVASRPIGGDQHLALYVGEAQSLYDRLNVNRRNHEGLQRAITMGATHISAMVVHGSQNRLDLETELRNSLIPPCNLQGKAAR